MRYDYTEARAKVDREGCCRVCGGRRQLEAAHIVPKAYDPDLGKGLRIVTDLAIVPLCGPLTDHACHTRYDRHELNLLPYLTNAEQGEAVAKMGMDRALHRMSGGWLMIIEAALM